MLVGKEEILQLIPQRFPIIMIEKLVSCDEKQTETALWITENNIFCHDGYFSEPGLVENIAQTAASRAGYLCRQQQIPVPIGYIGAVKNLEIYFLPEVNTEIQTQITVSHQVFDVSVIQGIIKNNGKIAARCEMKIFISRNKPEA
jgi:predicted hotdog family 3-hydroxylacyl-ACP dehydratase